MAASVLETAKEMLRDALGLKSVPAPPGVRVLRVRARLADGREFVSAATFVSPPDPNAPPAKDK